MPGHAGPNSKASGPVQESLLRLLAERSRDMIFRYRLRPEPGFEYVSPGVKHFSGYTPEEHYADPYLGDRTIHPDDWPILTALQQGVVPVEPVRVRWIRKDGSICWTEAEVMLERDEEGNVVALEGIVHDVTELLQREQQLRRANRALHAISALNRAVLHAEDERGLLEEACRILAGEVGYRLAWIGFPEHDARKSIRVAAWSGFDDGYLEQIDATWTDDARGRGPAGTALRTGQIVCCRDVRNDPAFLPWRAEALRRGFEAVASLPLTAGGGVLGVMTVYAAAVDVFEEEEMALLEEMAGDLAFGIASLRDREQHRRTEAALRESEGRYSSLFEINGAAMIISDPVTLQVVDANPAACAFYGWSRDQFVGMRLEDISTSERIAIRRAVDDAVDPSARLRSRCYQARHRLASGEVRDVELYSGPISVQGRQLLFSIIHDVTDRREKEEQVRISEARYHALSQLLGSYGYSLYISESGGVTIEWVTDTMISLFGYSARELRELDWRLLVHPDDREAYEASWSALLQNQPAVGDLRVLTRSGDIRWVRASSFPEYDERAGRVVRIYGAGQDITVSKEAERELIRAKEKAEEINRLKTAFLANMSHEIRTPLTAIIGFADVLGEGASEEKQTFARMIRSSGERLLTTLNSVLDLAQLESGSLHLRYELVDIRKLVNDVLDLFDKPAQVRQVRLLRMLPEGKPIVHLDAGAVSRILTNLVSNAVKFTREADVVVRVQVDDRFLTFEVRDAGIGMDRAFLPYLFDEFRQESVGIARGYEGTGLGLTITKRLVDLLQGTVEVQTEKGRGSTFTVRLPIRPMQRAPGGGWES